LGARYYDPLASRFISPDPLMNPADPKTLDAYMYSNNNPVMFSDATGLTPYYQGNTKILDEYYADGSQYKTPTSTSSTPTAGGSNHRGSGKSNDTKQQLTDVFEAGGAMVGPDGNACGQMECAEQFLNYPICAAGQTGGSCWHEVREPRDCGPVQCLSAGDSLAVMALLLISIGAFELAGVIVDELVAGGLATGRAATGVSTATRVRAGEGAATESRAVIPEGKWDYIFGRVTSNAHNLERSQQLERSLNKIGVFDTAAGRGLIQEHMDATAASTSNVVEAYTDAWGAHQVRESLLFGPQGAVKLETTFMVTEDGLRFETTIPYGAG